jgi:hypothetical protein
MYQMKSVIFATMMILGMRLFAAEDPIAEQIIQSQTTGRKIVLVLGATPSESGNLKFTGFDQDPFVVYFNAVHFRDIEHLKCEEASAERTADWEKQFIQGNFNSLSDLSAIQERFSTCFDLITLDFSVSKFMNFTNEHLEHFLGMLNMGGTMVFDYKPSCYLTSLSKDFIINSEDIAREACLKLLDPNNPTLMHELMIKIMYRKAFTEEAEIYSQYIAGWKTIHMLDTCELYVVEDHIFPYWQATEHEYHGDRNQSIEKQRRYLVMRRLS